MHRPEQIDAHHLRDAARVVPLALVHRRFEERFRMPGLNADHRQTTGKHASAKPLNSHCGQGPA
jgi:hypothetical protein